MSFAFRYGRIVPAALVLALGQMNLALAQEAAPPVAGVLAAPVIEPGARELLEATQARYRALKSYAGRLESRSSLPTNVGWADLSHYNLDVAWERPGRVRAERFNLAGKRLALAVSDGKLFHAELAEQNGVFVERAASERTFYGAMKEAGGDSWLVELMKDTSGVAVLDTGLVSLRLMPNQRLDGLEMRCLEARMRNKLNESYTLTWLVGVEDGLLHQATSISGEGKERISFTETHREIRTDPILPAATWDFTPPAGAKAVAFQAVGPMPSNLTMGGLVPDFKSVTLDGKPFSLADADGRSVIIQFFTVNSPSEAAELMAAEKRFGKENLSVVGVAMDGKREVVEQFATDHAVRYPILFEWEKWTNAVAIRLGVRFMPTILFVGRDGTLQFVGREIDELLESGAIEAELGANRSHISVNSAATQN